MFGELEKSTVISAEKQDVSLITNMAIDARFFEEHARFFSSIGYIALQIAQIEDEIRQSMIAMTGDWDAVDGQTKGKHLGALLSLYEIVFLAKFSHDDALKRYFQAVKQVVAKANKYRNIAVHENWMFIDADPERPCFADTRNDTEYYVIIPPALMRKRAMFTHVVFQYMKDLRAVTEGPDGWSPEGMTTARADLEQLAQGKLREF
jgi:hypothetical protein